MKAHIVYLNYGIVRICTNGALMQLLQKNKAQQKEALITLFPKTPEFNFKQWSCNFYSFDNMSLSYIVILQACISCHSTK